VKGGKKGKRQGIEGSANANDVWVWMRPHIGFCTIGKCDLLPFFLLIESLPTACKFHPFFSFRNVELLHMRFHLFCFSILAPFFFFSSVFSFSFEDSSFTGERFHSLEFSRRITC
jgi:hypothetical protein